MGKSKSKAMKRYKAQWAKNGDIETVAERPKSKESQEKKVISAKEEREAFINRINSSKSMKQEQSINLKRIVAIEKRKDAQYKDELIKREYWKAADRIQKDNER